MARHGRPRPPARAASSAPDLSGPTSDAARSVLPHRAGPRPRRRLPRRRDDRSRGRTLRAIAEAKRRNRLRGPPSLAGHCCSLSTSPRRRRWRRSTSWPRRGSFDVVSLPMCNLYLQDRHGGRTPRNRGITLVHEMKARRHPRRLRLRQHPRPVLRLWRSRHAGGDARGDPHRPSRPPTRRLARRLHHHPREAMRDRPRPRSPRRARGSGDLQGPRWTELLPARNRTASCSAPAAPRPDRQGHRDRRQPRQR
jgi:hypothetical protein